mmetsp:Transcript_23257/g.65354  ORF Transcript_23257/g.65354 Transcript_23257/m.65354 type:complete len:278 (+) Transcript_23257:883-1716(+)
MVRMVPTPPPACVAYFSEAKWRFAMEVTRPALAETRTVRACCPSYMTRRSPSTESLHASAHCPSDGILSLVSTSLSRILIALRRLRILIVNFRSVTLSSNPSRSCVTVFPSSRGLLLRLCGLTMRELRFRFPNETARLLAGKLTILAPSLGCCCCCCFTLVERGLCFSTLPIAEAGKIFIKLSVDMATFKSVPVPLPPRWLDDDDSSSGEFGLTTRVLRLPPALFFARTSEEGEKATDPSKSTTTAANTTNAVVTHFLVLFIVFFRSKPLNMMPVLE